MFYAPTEKPGEVFFLITILVIVGIIGGYVFSYYFMLLALLFWVQYTLVLSYFQFKRKRKHNYSSLTQTLLHPQIRFFLFEFVAVLGIISLLMYGINYLSTGALGLWWLLALNFYIYYTMKRKK